MKTFLLSDTKWHVYYYAFQFIIFLFYVFLFFIIFIYSHCCTGLPWIRLDTCRYNCQVCCDTRCYHRMHLVSRTHSHLRNAPHRRRCSRICIYRENLREGCSIRHFRRNAPRALDLRIRWCLYRYDLINH